MADLQAFLMGANVITSFKDNKFRAMTCAWSMMCDYDKVMMLLGSTSDTGKALKKDDLVGVSALSKGQSLIAKHFGDNHSDSFAKFNQHYLEKIDNVYVVKEAKVKMVCKVLDVLHIDGIKEDYLVYLQVLNFKNDESKEYLNANDVLS